jgi:hypothetical protein
MSWDAQSPNYIHGQRSILFLDREYTQCLSAESLRQVFAFAGCPTVRDKDEKQCIGSFLSSVPRNPKEHWIF